MKKLIISGASGHMGHAVAEMAEESGFEVVAGVDQVQSGFAFPIKEHFNLIPERCDVIIDFSRPALLSEMLEYALDHTTPIVIATTGYNEEQIKQIHEASKVIPVFMSANMSLGIAVLKYLAHEAALRLASFDIEIIEAHHNRKADAPSGTALLLYDAVSQSETGKKTAVMGRSGKDCKRSSNEIGIHAVRGGTIVGEHQVGFFGPQERITLSHSAESRSVFAAGALKAAMFLQSQTSGFYTMDDMLKII